MQGPPRVVGQDDVEEPVDKQGGIPDTVNRAIEIRPDGAQHFAGRGEIYRAMGRDGEARADFDRATELDPSYPPPTV